MKVIFLKCQILMFFPFWNVKKRKSRSHGKICTEKTHKYFSKGSFYSLKQSWSTWFISVLRNVELEANKLYNRANKLYEAALLTRCYVHHSLSPYIDSEVNHKRHFIKRTFDTLIGYLPIFQMLPKTSLSIRYHWYPFELDA